MTKQYCDKENEQLDQIYQMIHGIADGSIGTNNDVLLSLAYKIRDFLGYADKHRIGFVTDIDNNVYRTVKIGKKLWMAENLKVTRYRNGDPIPNVVNNIHWENLNAGACCSYDNDPVNANVYGRLYNWYAVNDRRNIAPSGWHVPMDEEWKQLEMALGMSRSEADDAGWRGTNEGSKLAGNASLWKSGNLVNNAEFSISSLSALPNGYRYGDNGGFYYMGYVTSFWSSTEYDSDHAWDRSLSYSCSGVYRSYSSKQDGFSIRCVKD